MFISCPFCPCASEALPQDTWHVLCWGGVCVFEMAPPSHQDLSAGISGSAVRVYRAVFLCIRLRRQALHTETKPPPFSLEF